MKAEHYIEKYGDMVAPISASYSKTYPMVDRRDISQELWLWFLTHTRKLGEWEKQGDEKETVKLVARSLHNAAYDYCIKEKARTQGYDPADNFWYRKEFIKTLLPATLSDDYRRIMQKLGEDSAGGKSPAESGDWMAYAADIRKAYEALSDEEQALVYNFYAIEIDGQALHEQFGEGKPTARATMMAANRALTKMVKNLGGFKPFHDPADESEVHVVDDLENDDDDDMRELL